MNLVHRVKSQIGAQNRCGIMPQLLNANALIRTPARADKRYRPASESVGRNLESAAIAGARTGTGRIRSRIHRESLRRL
jgi:hypothetical protein